MAKKKETIEQAPMPPKAGAVKQNTESEFIAHRHKRATAR